VPPVARTDVEIVVGYRFACSMLCVDLHVHVGPLRG